MSPLGPVRAISGLAADVAVLPPDSVSQALLPSASILSRVALRGYISAAAYDEAMAQVRDIGTGLAQRLAQQGGMITVDQRAETTAALRAVLASAGLDAPGTRHALATVPPPSPPPSGAFTYDRSGAKPAPPAGGT